MIRKFKLIKEYPDCGVKLGDIITFLTEDDEILEIVKENCDYFFTLTECKKYTEFWEEIIFSSKNSRGEEFKIGDKVTSRNNLWSDNCIIDSFVSICVANVKQGSAKSNYIINNLTKYPEIIHTTEDGLPIHKGLHPKIWYVNKSFSIGINQKDTLVDIDVEHYKYFSTEIATNEYIRLNKKQYSLQDIKSAIQTSYWQWTIDKENDLVLIDLKKLCK